MLDDSMSMYRGFRLEMYNEMAGGEYNPNHAMTYAYGVIKKIAEEISQPPYSLRNSPFILEVQKELKSDMYLLKHEISIDLYAITMSLHEYLFFGKDLTKCRTCLYYVQRQSLFGGLRQRLSLAAQTLQDCFDKIERYLNKLRSQDISSRVPISYSPPSAQVQGTASSFQGTASSFQSATPKQSEEIPVQPLPVQPSNTQAEQERINGMIYDNNAKIKEWHESQKEIVGSLKETVPEIRNALKKMMSFSDKITEDYVLRFAESYIRLYNLIHDGLTTHRETASRSIDNNYKRAVNNFEVYCAAIIRNLSAFGVEEIKTKPGTRFNGEIHEAINTKNFDSSRACVRESLKSGFRYTSGTDSIIIQKEEVNIIGG